MVKQATKNNYEDNDKKEKKFKDFHFLKVSKEGDVKRRSLRRKKMERLQN